MFGLTFKIWDKRISRIPLVQPRRALASVVAVALVLVGQVVVNEVPRLFAGTKSPVTWEAVFAWIQRDWPEVPQMITHELAHRMKVSDGASRPPMDERTHR